MTSIRGASGSEPLRAMPCPAGQESGPEHQQHIGQDGPDEGCLDDRREPFPQGENGHEQFGQVAQTRLQETGRARAHVFADLVDRLADQGSKSGDSQARKQQSRLTSGAPAAVHQPRRSTKTTALTIARRCNVPRASRVPGMEIDQRRRYCGCCERLYSKTSGTAQAAWPSGPGKGLQSPLQRFDSARRLQRFFTLDCRSEAIFGVPGPDR